MTQPMTYSITMIRQHFLMSTATFSQSMSVRLSVCPSVYRSVRTYICSDQALIRYEDVVGGFHAVLCVHTLEKRERGKREDVFLHTDLVGLSPWLGRSRHKLRCGAMRCLVCLRAHLCVRAPGLVPNLVVSQLWSSRTLDRHVQARSLPTSHKATVERIQSLGGAVRCSLGVQPRRAASAKKNAWDMLEGTWRTRPPRCAQTTAGTAWQPARGAWRGAMTVMSRWCTADMCPWARDGGKPHRGCVMAEMCDGHARVERPQRMHAASAISPPSRAQRHISAVHHETRPSPLARPKLPSPVAEQPQSLYTSWWPHPPSAPRPSHPAISRRGRNGWLV